jgi:hypothetical protein
MAKETPLNWLDDDQKPADHTGPRYEIRGEDDGTWSVYDTRSDLPVVWEEKMMVKLTFDEADEMLELMNRIGDGVRGE